MSTPGGATLYRCRTPTNRLCPCGRVARELRARGYELDEVRVPWRKRDRDEVEDASGQRVVPVVEFDDGDAICDSKRILEHLRWRAESANAPTGQPAGEGVESGDPRPSSG